MRTLSTALAAAALWAGPLVAAQDPIPLVPVEHRVDTGFVSNDGPQREVIISFPVVFEGVSSIRLDFEEVVLSGSTALGDASTLRITSYEDGAVQTMNAVHVQQWGNKTAYFNGNAVQVEVIASPGTGENRLVLQGLEVGVPQQAQETICGTDDRLPSNDQRVARLLPIGCTAWVINDCGKCLLSAGHCSSGTGSVIQFNVPFSSPSGSLNMPAPEDQYAYDAGTSQFLNSIDDWRYFGVFPNPNTGLTPYESYGVAFDLGPLPSSVPGNDIRITGHGVDSTPDSTYNQIQQTQVGPLVSIGTNLNYQTDTTGGNSGSPVIWENTGLAIGIHTNGGCSTSGSGSNNGTPITANSLQNALNNPLGSCAASDEFADLGESLFVAPFNRPPNLKMCGDLLPGTNLSIDLGVRIPPTGIGYSMQAYLILGLSPVFTPFNGGVLVPSPDNVKVFGIDTSMQNTGLSFDVPWPSGIASGTDFWFQGWLPFSDGGSTSGVLATNALNFTTP